MTTPLALRLSALLAVFCATPCAALPAEARVSISTQDEKAEDEKPIERLEEWPAVADKGALKKDVARLRKAHTEEMGVQAHEALLAMGASTAPALLVALDKEKKEDARDRVVEVLEAVCDARHTRLLAAEFGSKSERVRLFCLHRVALFPDEGVREQARAHFDAVAKKKDKASPEEKYAAALCLASTGDPAGLDTLVEKASKHWKKSADELRAATLALRGNKSAIEALTPKLAEATDRSEKVTALRLLATIGDRETARTYFRTFLDQNDNSLRIAAINACRGIFDGDPPLAKLPVFEAIGAANKWKERL